MNISKRKLFSYEEYVVGNKSRHTESIFFNIPNKPDEIIKLYDSDNGDYLYNKKRDINNLIRFGKEYNMPEIILPKDLLKVNLKFKGIILPKLNGANARIYLTNKNVPISIKIKILKQIGSILEKLNNITNGHVSFADVHNDNFFVCNENGTIRTYALDAESMKMYDSKGRLNFYICYNDTIKNYEKYARCGSLIGEASYQTDLFCFIMMILELLTDKEDLVRAMNIDDFYEYLDYLSLLGFNSELLTCLLRIYDKKDDNINPLPYLDYLDKFSEKASWDKFLEHKTLAMRPKL